MGLDGMEWDGDMSREVFEFARGSAFSRPQDAILKNTIRALETEL